MERRTWLIGSMREQGLRDWENILISYFLNGGRLRKNTGSQGPSQDFPPWRRLRPPCASLPLTADIGGTLHSASQGRPSPGWVTRGPTHEGNTKYLIRRVIVYFNDIYRASPLRQACSRSWSYRDKLDAASLR